jgi:hypothetical protein
VQVLDWRELPRHDLHGHLARHLARRVAAHPVRDDEEAASGREIGEEVVLVPRPDHSDVGTSGDRELH